jgi:hypothetical protein
MPSGASASGSELVRNNVFYAMQTDSTGGNLSGSSQLSLYLAQPQGWTEFVIMRPPIQQLSEDGVTDLADTPS